MDLSNLSSNLPPTKLLELVSLLNINNDLTDEFKNAAKSVAALYNASANRGELPKDVKAEFANTAKAVASLYRLGSSSNVLLMHKGYLECLDDLLSVIANGEDIENWALTKRAEITNIYNHKDDDRDEHGRADARELRCSSPVPRSLYESDLAETVLPSDYDFAFPPELEAHTAFPPSFAPLSVNYKRGKNLSEGKHKKPQSLSFCADTHSVLSEVESDASDSNSDAELKKKRKALKVHHDLAKRRKRESSCESD